MQKNKTEENGFYTDSTPKYYAENIHILKWWEDKHDKILVQLICKYAWAWHAFIIEEIEKNINSEDYEKWKNQDPLCKQYAYYNILMNFSIAKAKKEGFTNHIKSPTFKKCELCKDNFLESNLPVPMVKRISIENIYFCTECLEKIIYQYSGNDNSTKKEIKVYIQSLTKLLGRIPYQDFFEKSDFSSYSKEALTPLFNLAINQKPTSSRIKDFYSTWLEALIDAEVLENGARRTSRGTQTLAKDGHLCLSLAEKTIDDFLYERNIIHDKEPKYPEGNYRADFKVGNIFIEYFGLKGDIEYDKKTKLKQKICKKHNIELISIYPTDIVSLKKLESKLKRIIE